MSSIFAPCHASLSDISIPRLCIAGEMERRELVSQPASLRLRCFLVWFGSHSLFSRLYWSSLEARNDHFLESDKDGTWLNDRLTRRACHRCDPLSIQISNECDENVDREFMATEIHKSRFIIYTSKKRANFSGTRPPLTSTLLSTSSISSSSSSVSSTTVIFSSLSFRFSPNTSG